MCMFVHVRVRVGLGPWEHGLASVDVYTDLGWPEKILKSRLHFHH